MKFLIETNLYIHRFILKCYIYIYNFDKFKFNLVYENSVNS